MEGGSNFQNNHSIYRRAYSGLNFTPLARLANKHVESELAGQENQEINRLKLNVPSSTSATHYPSSTSATYIQKDMPSSSLGSNVDRNMQTSYSRADSQPSFSVQYVANKDMTNRGAANVSKELLQGSNSNSSEITAIPHSSGLNDKVCRNINKNLRGLTDFGKVQARAAFEIFLTFEAPWKEDAIRLFNCLKEIYKNTVVLARMYTDGCSHPLYVHVYCGGKTINNPRELKSLVERMSRMRCVEIKRVTNTVALLRSMTPKGCPLVLRQKVPRSVSSKVNLLSGRSKLNPKKKTTPLDKKKKSGEVTILDEPVNEVSNENDPGIRIQETIQDLETEILSLEEILNLKRAELKQIKDMRDGLNNYFKNRKIGKELNKRLDP